MIRQFWDQARRQLVVPQLPKLSQRFAFSPTPKTFELFAVLCCFEQHLILTSFKANQSQMIIDDCFSIDLPTHLIGDSGVENPSEVSQIILDLMEVMGLSTCPVLLLLSSSKFSHTSFDVDKISAWNLSDPKIRGKSPFLPDETLIHLSSGESKSSAEQSMRSVSYANTRMIYSWMDVLQAIGQPVLGISPLYSGLIDWLQDFKDTQKSAIFCDVETNCCSLLINNKSTGIFTLQLPFGTSLYSGQSTRLLDQFFKRLESSLDIVKDEYALYGRISYIISGYGLSEFQESLPVSLRSWKLLSNLTSGLIEVSGNLKAEEHARHQYLFAELGVGLYAYLQS